MVNKAILIGNIGKDCEVKDVSWGKVVSFTLATSESWKDRNTGERKTRTQWHYVQITSKIGPAIAEYLVKGQQVYIEGTIKYNQWEDENGVKKSSTQIEVGIGGVINLIGKANSNEGSGGNQPEAQSNQGSSNPEDDLPF